MEENNTNKNEQEPQESEENKGEIQEEVQSQEASENTEDKKTEKAAEEPSQTDFHKLEPIMSWEAPTVTHHEKSRVWYVIAAVVSVLAILYFIFTDAASGAIAVLLLAGVYFLSTSIKPKIIKIEVNELGIQVDKEFYAYSGIRFFWIIYNPPHTVTLNFATVGRVGKIVNVQLGMQDPAALRNYLRTQIPEVEGKKEGVFESMNKVLRI